MTENETQGAPGTTAPRCPKCSGDMWDNRATKRNPRAPDFKCKDRACDGVIWPPRDASTGPAAAAAPRSAMPRAAADDAAEAPPAPRGPAPAGTADDPACPVCGGKMWDDRSSKRNPRAPDFKCRNKPKTIGGPGCPGVIWPPRDGESRPAASAGRGSASSASAAPRGPSRPADPVARSSAPDSAPPPPPPKEYWDSLSGPDDDEELPF